MLVATACSLPGSTKGPLTITATFKDVGDLVVNHSVQVADVRVGSVTKIELTPDFKAKVTMSLKDVNLKADAVAILRQTSLLGEKFIEIRPCDPSSSHQDTGCDASAGPLKNHTDIPLDHGRAAPELEFVADTAIRLLAASGLPNDFATLVQTGSVGFAGRADELRGLIGDLSTISSTLADHTNNIISIIDGLDQATSTLAANDPALDQLLVNLSNTTTVLANNRDQTVATLQALTRLAQAQNDLVFEPYLQQVDRQVKELDAIVNEVAQGRGEVRTLIQWIDRFVHQIPLGIPDDFAQVYAWFINCTPASC
ncbi:MAG: phospholipid/cholesterol/gamma-HCH transport system substrate-binding protein [Acidimicrobiaceae bacterium]|jgi:phospholipid/cholesterol/gamma-HCH transport system substrate-binding protein